MKRHGESELILNTDNSVYHLSVKAEHVADDVILVGDPGRVETISRRFGRIDFRASHREFVTHTGYYGPKRITVMSTGIGTDNIDIVMNELDAAVNIDPVTRTERSSRRRLRLYRLGTSGALQEDIPVNALVASTHGLGFDGLMNYYAGWRDVNVNGISEAFRAHTGWDERLPYPYCVEGSSSLLAQVAGGFIQGITATAPGFYGPQGREIRLASALPSLEDDLATFSYNGKRITNFEMETSALYGLGTLLGHDCLTVCVIIANRRRREFTKNYADSVAQMIDHCLNQIASTT